MLVESPGSTKSNFRGFSGEELKTTDAKMEQQQQHLQHIKRLLTTAGSAAGLVGDVEGTPAAVAKATTAANQPPIVIPSRKGERNLWRLEEIKEMLTIMQEQNALDLLNDKMIKSENVFYDIEKVMIRRGYNKKTHNQIWTKWKFLKSTYMTSRRNGVIPKMIPGEIYLILHKMLGNGSDLVYSLEDSSNAPSFDGEHSVLDDDMDSLPPAALQNGKNFAGDKNEAFGMAHPIFGFRLGMVKSEPADTGYETTANNSVISENDSLDNNAIYPVGLSPPQNSQESIAAAQERVTASPAGDTNRSSPSASPDSNSLLMPRETAAMSIRPVAVKQKITPQRQPPQPSQPLRIANFAKESTIAETKEKEFEPTAKIRSKEISSTKNGSLITLSPALTIPSSNERGSIVRLPRDVTLQLRTKYSTPVQPQQQQQPKSLPSSASTSGAAYALRADEQFTTNRLKPTTAHLKSQHQQSQPPQQHEQPMTSQMAKLRANILNKKRRLDIPNWDTAASATTELPNKMPRFQNTSNFQHHAQMRNNSFPTTNKNRYLVGDVGDDDDDDDNDDDDVDGNDDEIEDFSFPNFMATPSTSAYNATAAFQGFPAYQQHFAATPMPPTKQKTKFTSTPTAPPMPPFQQQQQPQQQQADFPKRSAMEDVLKDMAMSLRQSQLQMVNDFFEQQMELARKDHEFQMEQDRLLMLAFKKQTQKLMQAAKQLFADKNENAQQNKSSTISEHNQKSNKNYEHHKTKTSSTAAKNSHAPTAQVDLSSSDAEDVEDELQENGESDPLLSNFDPTQFVSSELMDTNDENDEDDDDDD